MPRTYSAGERVRVMRGERAGIFGPSKWLGAGLKQASRCPKTLRSAPTVQSETLTSVTNESLAWCWQPPAGGGGPLGAQCRQSALSFHSTSVTLRNGSTVCGEQTEGNDPERTVEVRGVYVRLSQPPATGTGAVQFRNLPGLPGPSLAPSKATRCGGKSFTAQPAPH